MVIEHPAGEHGLGSFLDPLVDQGGNFLAEIGGVIEASELEALQGSSRSSLQIIERGSETRNGHGQSSDIEIEPKGPSS